jgi:hypothetical protein
MEVLMHTFSGRLLQRGEVVLDAVRGTIEVHKRAAGDVSWTGRLYVPRGAGLEEAASYLLLFDDGSSGVILTARMSLIQGRVVLSFVGTSPLQGQINDGKPLPDGE